MTDRRREAYELAQKFEKFLDAGCSTAAVMAPEKVPLWSRALILTRCLRFELGRPPHTAKAAASTQGKKTTP